MVTHRTREDLLGDNGGTFAFAGLREAARRAKEAAGDKDVLVLGGGTPPFAGERARLIQRGESPSGGP
ncbi:hypothetical protein [Streptomyces sp. NPDC088746]|uniref:hypothetical protein n=1 Tax=Streptomyces sp. NPDC088746 TaxID=3365885 RepID=UPI003810FC2B